MLNDYADYLFYFDVEIDDDAMDCGPFLIEY